MADQRRVLIIKESLMESVLSDAVTYGGAVFVIGLGVWCDSAAMQWFGFIVATLGAIGSAHNIAERSRCTIAEARAKLDAWEKEGADG